MNKKTEDKIREIAKEEIRKYIAESSIHHIYLTEDGKVQSLADVLADI